MIYIRSAAHISIQEPLLDNWFHEPRSYDKPYNRTVEPDFKTFLSPIASRRMSPIIKRAIVTSRVALERGAIPMPDAVISGTGLGCVENTEKFLDAMVRGGEQFLQPTHFIQSTHNTVSSQIALDLQCTGYNTTYAHRGTSFESALLDGYLQFRLSKIRSALIGGHDELTPIYFDLLRKIGYWREEVADSLAICHTSAHGAFAGEGSTSILLSDESHELNMAQIESMELTYRPNADHLESMVARFKAVGKIDALVMGLNGDMANDKIYIDFARKYFPETPIATFKNLSGEYFTSSAFGIYTVAYSLQKGHLSDAQMFNCDVVDVQRVLFYNHFQDRDHSLILLSRC